MMDFISIPLTIGIISFAMYKLIELYVRKKERLLIIEKLSQLEKATVENFNLSGIFGGKSFPANQFISLRIGCLLIGLGLGLLIGFLIANSTIPVNYSGESWRARELMSIVYGSSTLLFGGIGLVAGFIVERKMIK
jgi:hypothetical protein